MNKNPNKPLIQLSNSSKTQLKNEADQWVAKARKDSQKWNKMLIRQSSKNNSTSI